MALNHRDSAHMLVVKINFYIEFFLSLSLYNPRNYCNAWVVFRYGHRRNTVVNPFTASASFPASNRFVFTIGISRFNGYL